MKENYKQIFDLFSPAESDDDFIIEVRRKAEKNTMKERKKGFNPIYALTGALIAIFAISIVAINLISGNKNYTEPFSPAATEPAATEELVSTEANPEAEPIVIISPDEPDVITIIDPGNPYNFTVHDNPHDFDIKILNISGDKEIMKIMVEVDGLGYDSEYPFSPELYFTDEKYYKDDMFGEYGRLITGNQGIFNHDDEKMYIEYYIPLDESEGINFAGMKLEFALVEYFYEPPMSLKELEELGEIGVTYLTEEGEEIIITEETVGVSFLKYKGEEKHYSAIFTVNYEPREPFITEYTGDNIKEIDNLPLEKITLSDYWVEFQFVKFQYNVDNISEVYEPIFSDGHEFFELKYQVKFTGGEIEDFYIQDKSNHELYTSGGTSGPDCIRFNINRNGSKPISTLKIDAFIIDGEEFQLDW